MAAVSAVAVITVVGLGTITILGSANLAETIISTMDLTNGQRGQSNA